MLFEDIRSAAMINACNTAGTGLLIAAHPVAAGILLCYTRVYSMNSLLQVLSDLYCLYLWVIRAERVTVSKEVASAVSDGSTQSELLRNKHHFRN